MLNLKCAPLLVGLVTNLDLAKSGPTDRSKSTFLADLLELLQTKLLIPNLTD